MYDYIENDYDYDDYDDDDYDYSSGITCYAVALPAILKYDYDYQFKFNNLGRVHPRLFSNFESARKYGLKATKKIILKLEDDLCSLDIDECKKLKDLVSKTDHERNVYFCKIELNKYSGCVVYYKYIKQSSKTNLEEQESTSDWKEEDLEWLFNYTNFADSYIETLFKVIEMKL